VSALTPHEHRVLVQLVESGRQADTARDLDLALSTVKNALLSARRKVGVETNVQLAYALATGDLDVMAEDDDDA
jgi:DNA-binding CsgD family transcriptional regulator